MMVLKKASTLVCLVVIAGTLAACAPADLVLVPKYRTVGEHKGAGQLVLGVATGGPGVTGGVEREQFVYGEVRTTDGKIKGNVLGPVAPAVLVRDALQQELITSGYSVQFDTAAAARQAERGVVLTMSSLSLDEVASLVKIEAECRVHLVLELWQQGKLLSRLTYSKTLSDFAVRDREQLHQKVLQKTLATVMQSATADLTAYFK
jgi:hypothetical protein